MTQANHEDLITLTMITAGAALFAAVFFILNIDMNGGSNSKASLILELGLSLAATVAYGLLFLHAGGSLVSHDNLTGVPKLRFKRERNRKVIMFFWIMLIITLSLVFVKFTGIAFQEGLSQSNQPSQDSMEKEWMDGGSELEQPAGTGEEPPGDPSRESEESVPEKSPSRDSTTGTPTGSEQGGEHEGGVGNPEPVATPAPTPR